MSDNQTGVIVLAAGLGTRMKSSLPKALQPIGGRPMVGHLMATLGGLEAARTIVVVGPDMEAVAAAVAPARTAVQPDRLGTADAVKAARDAMQGLGGTVLIVFADTSLIRRETLARMIAAREAGAAVVVLGFRPEAKADYGRLITAADGALERIVEAGDASQEELGIDLCNSGVMAVDGAALFDLIDRVGNDNAKHEFHLTDIVALARADGRTCAFVEGNPAELLGINTKADLAAAEAIVQTDLRAAAMAGGATLIDPDSVWLSHDTELGPDVVLHPHVVIGPGVQIAEGAVIKSFSHLEGAAIGKGAVVGPFARLRPGTDLGAHASIGNFVEAKNAVVGEGARINHLTYVGDAEIGAGTNIGAGTITCNYDGATKHKTVIGEDVFIGSNTVLIAPVEIGDGAFIAAASAITQNVEPGGLAVARARQVTKPERGRQLKEKLKARNKK